jgi:predicted enzyme involved in methoxymalonyl-ACP biosynthesis
VVIVRREGVDRVFDSFVMSCRAMGLGLERLVLRLVIDSESARGARFVGRYIASDRNAPCEDLFRSNGFTRVNETDWELPNTVAPPERPPWFEVVR